MNRTFIELSSVTRVLRSTGVSDEGIRRLQLKIAHGGGDLVSGTGGVRKLRCSVEGRGKSGGIRVLFADYPAVGKCYLLVAFAKNVKTNLSKAERNELAKLKAALDQEMNAEKE